MYATFGGHFNPELVDALERKASSDHLPYRQPWQWGGQPIEIQFPHQNENSSTYLTLSLNSFPTPHVHSVPPPVGKGSPKEQ